MTATPLFTLEELASYLQRDLDTASATLAREAATALVQEYARRSFVEQVEATEILPIINGKIRLPHRPVADVESVRVIADDLQWPVPFDFDGRHTIDLEPDTAIINLPEDHDEATSAEVVYTHGHPDVPPAVKAVALAVAGRCYSNPRGLRSETIGAYSYTQAGGGDDVASVGLLVGEKAVLDNYRVRGATVALAP